jgi:hypothetical protein
MFSFEFGEVSAWHSSVSIFVATYKDSAVRCSYKKCMPKQPKCIGYSGILHLPNFHKITCTSFQREMKVSPMHHFSMKNIE